MLRLSELLILAAVLTLIVLLNVPMLLAPAFVLMIMLLSVYRWSRRLHPWSMAESSVTQGPSFVALSFTAAGLFLLVSGVIGYNASRHDRFVEGTAWRDSVIWWEVLAGAALVAMSVYWWRRFLTALPRS